MSAGCEWPRFCRHDPTGEKMNLHLSEISQKRDIVRHYGFNGVDGCRTVGFCFFIARRTHDVSASSMARFCLSGSCGV